MSESPATKPSGPRLPLGDESGESLSGRYSVFSEIACGGMAMVYLGQLEGGHGFKRSVAIKRMHPQFARDLEFREMFLDEARLVARIRHPNVVPTLDIVARENAILIVMEFVEGESVAAILKTTAGIPFPPRISAAIVHDALCGLHAAHELTDDEGRLLDVIHRDVSPANILVGKDGMARILDFGVAKAAGRTATTKDGSIKGKIPYMTPEHLWGSEIDRTVDTFAAAIVLWELLTSRRLFKGESEAETMQKVVDLEIQPPSSVNPEAAPLDDVVMKGLSRDPSKRWKTALEMARAIEKALPPAPRLEIAEWVASAAGDALARRVQMVRAMQRGEAPAASFDIASVAEVLTASTPRTAVNQSVSRRSVPPPGRFPSRAVLAGALAVLLTIGVFFVIRSRHGTDAPKVATAEPALTAPLPSASSPVPSASPAPAAASVTPVTPPSASASQRALPRPAPGPPATKPVKANCQPPWTLDAEGNKHFKVECL